MQKSNAKDSFVRGCNGPLCMLHHECFISKRTKSSSMIFRRCKFLFEEVLLALSETNRKDALQNVQQIIDKFFY